MNDTTPLEPTPATPVEPTTPRRRGVLRPILIGVGSGVAVLALGLGGFALADELGDNDDDRVVITSSDRPVDTTPSSGTDASTGTPSPDASPVHEDTPISQEEYDAVSAAALAAVGGGTVTELKRDDDRGKAWEVEILLANGDEAEVEMDAALNVLRIDLDRND